jgi:hypothetical protein
MAHPLPTLNVSYSQDVMCNVPKRFKIVKLRETGIDKYLKMVYLCLQEAAMSENLTLSMDSEIIEFASDFSRKINKPISRIIEDYFIELKERNSNDLHQVLQELYGIFEEIDTPEKSELRSMFHEKHNN